MYYLFLKNPTKLEKYKDKFIKVKSSIENGTTPVFNEMSAAKTNLVETMPYNILNGILLIIGTLILEKLNLNPILSVAIVLIVNSLCGCISNYIFVAIKHRLRLKLCDRLSIERSDANIAVMESLEYQTVGGYCTRKRATLENDYCSYGERMDRDTNER